VQIANGSQYRQRAEVNRIRVVSEKALRGVVYDRAGRQVARNVPSWTAAIRPADLPRDKGQRTDLFERLGRVLQLDPQEIAKTVDEAREDPFTPARVKSPIPRDLALVIEEQQGLFPGVVIQYTPIRAYPEGPLLGQILGYTAPIPAGLLQNRLETGYERDDTLGITGIESAFEDELRGSRGRKQVEVDALGRVMNEIAVLQPTEPSEDPWRPMVNHAIGGQYPPASTFKMVTAAAALQEKIVSPQTRLNCVGSITVQGRTFKDWDPKGHGNVDTRAAIATSCDIYFYTLNGGNPYTGLRGLGIAKLGEYARAFGFGERTGLRLPGEARGLVPSEEWKREVKKEGWFIGDNFNTGIGQGDLLATPLQLANMTAAIANGGTLYRPRLASATRDAEGNVRQTFQPEVIRKLSIAPEYMAAIRAGMRDVVASTSGTAYYALKQPSLSIAGKTGTAEFFGPLDRQGNLPTHALFVGYAPYEDPRVAVAVVVYHGGEGSETAAPVAADVLKAYFELGIR
jgi:penicillin-binding protein 2